MVQRAATFVIDCRSPEGRKRAEELVRASTDLLNVLANTRRAFPGGIEQRTTTQHRLGDYFDDIHIEDQDDESEAFRLVFNPRKDADRYWKDLMVQILSSLRKSIEDVSVKPLI